MLLMPQWTTIKVSNKTKQILDELKFHPEESYEKVLSRILLFVKSNKKMFYEWLGIPKKTIEEYKKILEKIDREIEKKYRK